MELRVSLKHDELLYKKVYKFYFTFIGLYSYKLYWAKQDLCVKINTQNVIDQGIKRKWNSYVLLYIPICT
jgi:hypothetical protein